jgi:hypothetical protein
MKKTPADGPGWGLSTRTIRGAFSWGPKARPVMDYFDPGANLKDNIARSEMTVDKSNNSTSKLPAIKKSRPKDKNRVDLQLIKLFVLLVEDTRTVSATSAIKVQKRGCLYPRSMGTHLVYGRLIHNLYACSRLPDYLDTKPHWSAFPTITDRPIP